MYFDSTDAGYMAILVLRDVLGIADLDTLLDRLKHSYGIGGTVLRWMRIFLTGRIQVICFNGHVSTMCPLTCKVPQGSKNEPNFFYPYTADVVGDVARTFSLLAWVFTVTQMTYSFTLIGVPTTPWQLLHARLFACIETIDDLK